MQKEKKNILHYGVCPELGGYAQPHSRVRKKSVENIDFTSEHDTKQTWTNVCMELSLRQKYDEFKIIIHVKKVHA